MKNAANSEAPARPSPSRTALSAPYWKGAEQGRLLLQKCANCGKVRHYPRLLCDTCYSDQTEWIEASGRGKVHSWTVCHHAFHLAFTPELPYTLVTVDLEEGVRALGRWGGDRLSIGEPVTAHFAERPEGPELFFASASQQPSEKGEQADDHVK